MAIEIIAGKKEEVLRNQAEEIARQVAGKHGFVIATSPENDCFDFYAMLGDALRYHGAKGTRIFQTHTVQEKDVGKVRLANAEYIHRPDLFYHDGKKLTTTDITRELMANSEQYERHGREIRIGKASGFLDCIKWDLFNYEQQIRQSGGIDLAVINLEKNIAGNYAPTMDDSGMHLGEVVDEKGGVIDYAYTMGLSTLAGARQGIVLGFENPELIEDIFRQRTNDNLLPALRGIGILRVLVDEDYKVNGSLDVEASYL